MTTHVCIFTLDLCGRVSLDACIFYMCVFFIQVDTLDETIIATKLGTYTTHMGTLDYVIENCDTSYNKYKAMLDD